MALMPIFTFERARRRPLTALRAAAGDLRPTRVAGAVRVATSELRLAPLTIEVKPTETKDSGD